MSFVGKLIQLKLVEITYKEKYSSDCVIAGPSDLLLVIEENEVEEKVFDFVVLGGWNAVSEAVDMIMEKARDFSDFTNPANEIDKFIPRTSENIELVGLKSIRIFEDFTIIE